MDLKQTACDIFATSVAAADPYERVRESLTIESDGVVVAGTHYPADRCERIVVVGAGKASARMAQAVVDVLGDRINGGWINTKYEHGLELPHITVHECGHPVPDEEGIRGSQQIIDLVSTADERTLVLCLLSGGGSALMPAPADGISLGDLQETTRILMNAGAGIEDLNAVRKHLSLLKGGSLARLVSPATLHVLILSDVVGDRLDTIASGPAVADDTTFGQCLDICTRFNVLDALPESVRERLERGAAGDVPETAKTGDAYLDRAKNSLVGNSRIAVDAARDHAMELGYDTIVLSTVLQGESRVIGNVFAALAYEMTQTGDPVEPPACIIGGGETTVTVRGKGKGGRNQEMVVAAAAALEGIDECVFLSGGTDGTDGPTDAAGGVVDGSTARLGREAGQSIDGTLTRNDSYNYLDAVDGLVRTGPTGTNVMDIQILLVGRPV